MLLGMALFFTGFCIMLLTISPYWGLLVTVLFKPIIDASWKSTFMGLNCLRVLGVAVPVILIFRMLIDRVKMPLAWLWLAYLLSNLLGFVIILNKEPIESLDFIFRILNGFIGFYLFQHYFSGRKDFRKLLLAYLIAGLFPMGMGVMQATIGGGIFNEQDAVGTFTRNVGVYNDAVSFRYYGFMTISSILLYASYYIKPSFKTSAILIGYAIVCLFVIYKTYSKAAVIIAGLWLFLWVILNKKYLFLTYIFIAVISFEAISGGQISHTINILFSKETAAVQGTGREMMVFAGRPFVWKEFLNEYARADLFRQLFGIGRSGGGTHNDFLRALVSSGLIGLTVYLFLLMFIGIKVVATTMRRPTPLNIMALMVFCGWMVDTIGLNPGLYPAYQWYVWGFIGLSLRGVSGLDPAENRAGGVRKSTSPHLNEVHSAELC